MSSSQLDRLSPFSSRLLYCRGAAMEAGGIEPPSRDVSVRASTCVVGSLKSRCRRPEPTRSARNQPRTSFNRLRTRHGRRRVGWASGHPIPPTRTGGRRYLFLGSECEITLGT